MSHDTLKYNGAAYCKLLGLVLLTNFHADVNHCVKLTSTAFLDVQGRYTKPRIAIFNKLVRF